jgi:hypothetical protein
MFWKGRHNGVFGPGGHTSWEFDWGKLAALIAVGTAVLLMTYFLLDIFGVL